MEKKIKKKVYICITESLCSTEEISIHRQSATLQLLSVGYKIIFRMKHKITILQFFLVSRFNYEPEGNNPI